jgi:hypothetical protein
VIVLNSATNPFVFSWVPKEVCQCICSLWLHETELIGNIVIVLNSGTNPFVFLWIPEEVSQCVSSSLWLCETEWIGDIAIVSDFCSKSFRLCTDCRRSLPVHLQLVVA